MIHWIVRSLDDHPDLERGIPPSGLLSPLERARLEGLHSAKRRRDWLLGRWTAKQLLQSALDQEAGVHLPLDAIIVETTPNGAPSVNLASGAVDMKHDSDWTGDHQSATPFEAGREAGDWGSLSLSISHSHGQAFCALSTMPGGRVGADIEFIEPRSGQFVADYFTVEEIARLPQEPGIERDTLVTAVWSAKEAVLKALGLGLTVDTRRVTCLLDPAAAAPGTVPFGYLWTRFAIQVHPGLLLAVSPSVDQEPVLTGWWHLMSNYVLTLVLMSQEPVPHYGDAVSGVIM